MTKQFTYNWKLSDLKEVKPNGYNVFSCFACGGGSTMGYKMSGYNVLGCNEIDPVMMSVYKKNHNPKLSYLESIETFKLRDDLPDELYNLDILDGSPPCSSFSMLGSREKAWGKKKKFREGQANQVLDDLFFHFIDLAKKLQPKVVISENVKGMLFGNAKGYVKQVINLFNVAGYNTQLFLLNGATMGLPQSRERVFFISTRKDLDLPKIKLSFNEKPIAVKEAISDLINEYGKDRSHYSCKKYWDICPPGRYFSSVHPKGSFFNCIKISPNKPFPTLASQGLYYMYRWDKMTAFTIEQLSRFASFPSDYNNSESSLAYQMGMSVPPIMMHKVSQQVKLQLLDKLKDTNV